VYFLQSKRQVVGFANLNPTFLPHIHFSPHQYFYVIVRGWQPTARRTRATLGTPSDFQWHVKAPSFIYQFYYDSHRSAAY